jgi:hypothetical protein
VTSKQASPYNKNNNENQTMGQALVKALIPDVNKRVLP